eukprot:gene8651-biopygen15554
MVRGSHILGIVVVSCLLRQAIGTAGGIETWCAFRDPFIDVGLTRATYFQGATPCRINGFDNSLTDCSTSDGWGIDIEQCVYPGYNPINQPVSYPANTVLPGYPGTFDQTLACNQVVFMSELVDSANITYGEVRVFKDYSDKLYVTATVRPVFFGSNSSMYQPPQLNSRQWLHSQPSAPVPFNQYSPATPLGPAAGKVIVANAANYDPTLSNAAYVNQLSISPITPSQFWSCWTYEVDLKAACNPNTAKHWVSGANSTGTGCLPNNVLDLTASTNLFLYVEFTIVALNLFNTSVSSLGPSCGTVADTKTIRLPGSGVVDLYAATIGTFITSTFYLNGSTLTAQSCLSMDIIIAGVLIGRQYIRVGCDVIAGPLSQLYYKVQFNNEADRDFLYYSVATPFFWGTLVYPSVKPGCGFFGLYTQTMGVNGAFSEPVFSKAPSSQPFVPLPTVGNPYYTACTSFTPANATTGMVTRVSNAVNASAVFGWAPSQLPSPFGQYNFGGSCINDTCIVPIGSNLGINSALYTSTTICSIVVSMTKNFSAGLPFDTQTDPARLAQNLNLLCGTGVRPAFGAQLFVPTGISAPAQIQVGALVYSAVDQTTFFNCINSSPSTIQVIALAYSLECTDSISIAYSCSAQPTSFYSGIANQPAGAMQWLHIDGATVGDVRCTNKGVGGDYVDVMYDTIDSAGLTSCLPSGSSDVLCSDSTATGSVITVVFTKQSCASDLYTAMTSGSGVLTAGYVHSAIATVMRVNDIDPAVAYPTSSIANGCSIVTASPAGGPVRVFYKAFLRLTTAQWTLLSSNLGLANAAFVVNGNVVCDSTMHFGPALDIAKKTFTSAEIPALANPAQCKAVPIAQSTSYYIETPITTVNQVSGLTITLMTCPPFSSAIATVMRVNGIDPAVAYPTSSIANGCSIVTASPAGGPVRVFYKAFLRLTTAQWTLLSSNLGLANAAYVVNGNVVCGSTMHFGPALDFAKKTFTSAEIPALANPAQVQGRTYVGSSPHLEPYADLVVDHLDEIDFTTLRPTIKQA